MLRIIEQVALHLRAGLLWAIVISLLAVARTASAGEVTLTWDPNPEPELAGYMLHYGTTSGNYSAKLDVGKVTQRTLSGLLEGKTYYYAVTAYDLSRSESGFSNEVTSTVPYSAPVANFSSSATSGSAPLSVTFTSTSSGTVTGYQWNFGDGTTSTAASPTHAYASAGSYGVSLTVSGPGGSNSITKTGYVTVTSATPTPAPVASFSANKTAGSAPLTVTFTSTSTGSISSYLWNFGDGTSANIANPSHTYSVNGLYTVTLTVTGSGGSHTATKVNYVTASSAAPSAIVVDNLGPALKDVTRSFTGTWCTETGTGVYGTPAVRSCGGTRDTYRWSFAVPATGAYDVFVRWPSSAGRSASVPFLVVSDAGWSTKRFNQQINGGTWMLHGRYNFTAGTKRYVQVSDVSGTASADAVRIVPASAASPAASAGGPGLVAAYGLDEGAGSVVADRSPNNYSGVITGATWVQTGRFGKALAFNGTSSWVTVADAASLDLTSGMTLQAWVFPTATMTGWRTIMMKEQSGGDTYYLSANSDRNQPATGVYASGAMRQLNGGTTIAVNAWSHLAATYDGVTQRLYINGVQVASRAQSGPIATSTGALRIGGNSVWGEYFKGYIDEVKLYKRALSQAEIQADMLKAVASL